MKIIICKSKTEKIKDSYVKEIFTVESDEIKENQLESTKQRLELLINEWLHIDEKIGNYGTRKAEKGKCAECGKAIKENFIYCYKCNMKHKGESR